MHSYDETGKILVIHLFCFIDSNQWFVIVVLKSLKDNFLEIFILCFISYRNSEYI